MVLPVAFLRVPGVCVKESVYLHSCSFCHGGLSKLSYLSSEKKKKKNKTRQWKEESFWFFFFFLRILWVLIHWRSLTICTWYSICEADPTQLRLLRCILLCFEAVLRLKINLSKSEILPGGAEEVSIWRSCLVFLVAM